MSASNSENTFLEAKKAKVFYSFWTFKNVVLLYRKHYPYLGNVDEDKKVKRFLPRPLVASDSEVAQIVLIWAFLF